MNQFSLEQKPRFIYLMVSRTLGKRWSQRMWPPWVVFKCNFRADFESHANDTSSKFGAKIVAVELSEFHVLGIFFEHRYVLHKPRGKYRKFSQAHFNLLFCGSFQQFIGELSCWLHFFTWHWFHQKTKEFFNRHTCNWYWC